MIAIMTNKSISSRYFLQIIATVSAWTSTPYGLYIASEVKVGEFESDLIGLASSSPLSVEIPQNTGARCDEFQCPAGTAGFEVTVVYLRPPPRPRPPHWACFAYPGSESKSGDGYGLVACCRGVLGYLSGSACSLSGTCD